MTRLLETLRIARGDGSYHKRLVALAKTELLILGDFGLKPYRTGFLRLLGNNGNGVPNLEHC